MTKRIKIEPPILSIITVVYNQGKPLIRTIESILQQNYRKIEYIIIDGGSTDNTTKVIRKYNRFISKWISEPDEGIYHAMNKGIQLATGDYIAFLNAGDYYAPKILTKVAEIIISNNPDLVYGDLRFIKLNKSIEKWKGNTGKNGTHIPHPSCFIKSEILKKEKFNTKYKLAADYDLILKLFQREIRATYLNTIIATFEEGGASSSLIKVIPEDFLITKKYLGTKTALKNTSEKIINYLKKR